jgi:hypothetical protein
MSEFNFDEFLAGIERDRSHSGDFDATKVLNQVMMSSVSNQGIVTFVPFISKLYNNFYLKVPGVCEFYGETELTSSGEGWFRLLPIDFYGQLTDTELELYNEVKALYNEYAEYDPGYQAQRIRTYSLFTGVQVSHVVDSDKSRHDELNDCACLYIFPSNRVIDAFNTAINSKIDVMKGSKAWIPAVLSPSNTGRRGVIQISFVKSTGAGYDANVAFEFNSELQPVIDPEKVFPDEVVNLFDDVLKVFLGWRYDKTNDKMFNLKYMQEFRDNLRLEIKRMNSLNDELPASEHDNQVYVNQNNPDPNKQSAPTAPAAPTAAPTSGTGVKPPF